MLRKLGVALRQFQLGDDRIENLRARHDRGVRLHSLLRERVALLKPCRVVAARRRRDEELGVGRIDRRRAECDRRRGGTTDDEDRDDDRPTLAEDPHVVPQVHRFSPFASPACCGSSWSLGGNRPSMSPNGLMVRTARQQVGNELAHPTGGGRRRQVLFGESGAGCCHGRRPRGVHGKLFHRTSELDGLTRSDDVCGAVGTRDLLRTRAVAV